LLNESECDDSQALFNSIDALRQANLLEEEDSITEEGSIRVSENLRIFLSGHASKDKLSEKDPCNQKDHDPILKPSRCDLLSPLQRKMIIFEEIFSYPNSKTTENSKKSLSILFSLKTSGFTSSPSLEFSNQKGKSRASVLPTSETHPLVSLFPSKVLKQVKNLNVELVSCGYEHVALLTIDGKVLTWGYGASGCLGHDNKKSYSCPTAINSIFSKNFKYLECGAYHSAAVSDVGELFTWGRSDVGQLGLGEEKMVFDIIGKVALRPFRVKWLKDVVSVACGEAHTLALDQTGEVFAFGWNEDGQLGHYGEGSQKVLGLKNVVKIAAGALFSAALTERKEVWVWGNGELGQLGSGSSCVASDRPMKVSGVSEILDITCGENSVLTLSKSSKIHSWGQGTVFNFKNPSNFPQGSEVNCFLPHELSECMILHSILMKKRKL
jgi:alpha-tubulin suppressor-like RCC1 family protein